MSFHLSTPTSIYEKDVGIFIVTTLNSAIFLKLSIFPNNLSITEKLLNNTTESEHSGFPLIPGQYILDFKNNGSTTSSISFYIDYITIYIDYAPLSTTIAIIIILSVIVIIIIYKKRKRNG
ncbi:MAG: hypothetical protein EAX96_18380 [Candidatus Lokiarchaeota archaeon]|nr:hypothetical protein [Candidatus Lokiarchaeota archaeon]